MRRSLRTVTFGTTRGRRSFLPLVAALVLVALPATSAHAAADLPLHPPGAYVSRDWPTPPTSFGFTSLQVDTTIGQAAPADPNTGYYYATDWLMNVGTSDSRYEYMGLQTFSTAIVSIFTTSQAESDSIGMTPGAGTDGQPADCHTGDTEGNFVTCRITFAWREGRTYRYRFAQTATSQWTATITDTKTGHVTTLGTFTVPVTWDGIAADAGSWIEQFLRPPEIDGSAPVCPSRTTIARYENARMNGTIAPIAEHDTISTVNQWGGFLNCQNGFSVPTATGERLGLDIPTPASPTKPQAKGPATGVVVSWTPSRNPATVTAAQLARAAGNPTKLAALAAIALPRPTSYTVTATPGGVVHTVPATGTKTLFKKLSAGTSYTFTIVANNDGSTSPPITVSYNVPGAGHAVR